MIAVTCPSCPKKLSVKDELAGKKVKCPGCGNPIAVPHAKAATLTSEIKPSFRSLPEERTMPPREDRTLPPEVSGKAGQESLSGASALTSPGAARQGEATQTQPTAAGNSDLWDFLAPAEQPDEIGRLGPYRVLKVLGAGGMGVVFRAEDPQLQRQVALKAMLPALASSPSAKGRFFREARAAAALKHPHIVTIFQVGEDRGAPFLAMEFLEGEALDEKLNREGKLPVPEILRIGQEIAEGLATAHEKGLIHRDIKPANIWLEGKKGHVKILDFGLARAMGDQSNLTQSGAIVGTPAYMAPEQAGGTSVDHRCDLFSLGCVLYRMCTGELPFKGNGTLAILTALALENPEAVRVLNPTIPAKLSDLVMNLLAKDPEKRLGSAEKAASLLAALEAGKMTAQMPIVQEHKYVCPLCAAAVKSKRAIPEGAKTKCPKCGKLVALRPPNSAEEKVLAFDVENLDDDQKDMAGKKKAPPSKTLTPLAKDDRKRSEAPGSSRWLKPAVIGGGAAAALILVVVLVMVLKGPGGGTSKDGVASQDKGSDKAAQAGGYKSAKENAPTFKNDLGMEFVLVPKGKSWLGGGGGKASDKEVEIAHDFYLGKFEVTQGEWGKVMGSRPSHFSRAGMGKDLVKDIGDDELARFPVEAISWDDAQLFLKELNKQAKEDGWFYRLPKETEWEYACRGGPMADRLEGAFDYYLEKPTDELRPDQANFANDKGLQRTCKVGSYKPNRLGLYDMHGNVREWCHELTTRFNVKADMAVILGGHWAQPVGFCSAAHRDGLFPSYRDTTVGLRVARIAVGKEPVAAPAAPAKNPEEKFKNTLGMEFVLVPKGKSWLGGGGNPGDKEVEIKEDFYLGKYEVTQEEWQKITGKTPSVFSRAGGGRAAVMDFPDAELKRFPVEAVTWDDAQKFLVELNKRDKQEGWVYRLPTEVEWEYACRGGPMSAVRDSAFRFYVDKPVEQLQPEHANFEHGKGLKRTCKVGSYKPNKLGLYDMHGNVFEMCEDAQKETDDKGAPWQVIRGGGWDSGAGDCETANRRFRGPPTKLSNNNIGLRVARVPVGKDVVAQPEKKPHGQQPAFKNSLGMKFVVIPSGKFMMGSSQAEINRCLQLKEKPLVDPGWDVARFHSEGPEHEVEITKPFYLGATEVTVGQFRQFVTENKYDVGSGQGAGAGDWQKPYWEKKPGEQTDDHPVGAVSWLNAVDFCAWLSKKEGKTYRLPTEAEWEYSCRAGKNGTRYSFGDDDNELAQYAWYEKNSDNTTHPVGTLKPNAWGLFDMHGNVWEWCQDNFDPNYYKTSPKQDPQGPKDGERLHHGGGFGWQARGCRAAFRGPNIPGWRSPDGGFRVALTIPPGGFPVSKEPAAAPPFKNNLGMEFVVVPRGKSWLGGGGSKQGTREVEIVNEFYLGKYEVTQEEWEKVTGFNPSHFQAVPGVPDKDQKRFPVEKVSWEDAQLFIDRLNKQVKEPGWVYRLPTEVEWEYACRGGPMKDQFDSAFDYYLEKPANQLLPEQANFAHEKGLGRPCMVGSYPPNRLGLHDMHGNVHEWCDDQFKDDKGASQRVGRGGGWDRLPAAGQHVRQRAWSRRRSSTAP